MKKSCLLLISIILIAGCTQSGLTPIVKSLPEVKEFLKEFPQATVTVAAYSPIAVKAVLKNFEEHCPNLGEEGKTYYKAAVIDPASKQMLVVWIGEENNKFVCAIRTSLSGEVVVTTSTTIPPTTTTAQITTTSQPTTTSTTLPPTTTTVNATNATTTSSTTTTISILPDLIGFVDVSPGSLSNYASFNFTIKNNGQLASRAGKISFSIWNTSGMLYSSTGTYPSLQFEETKVVGWGPLYTHAAGNYYLNLTIDSDNNTTESNKENNIVIKNYTMPLSGTTTSSSTTSSTTTTTAPPPKNLVVTATSVIKSAGLSTLPRYGVYIKNEWNSTISNFKVNYFVLAANSTVVENYTLIAFVDSGTTKYVSYDGSSLSAGTYNATIKADFENSVAETNETDNTGFISFSIPLP